jgi:hypothetical protein
MENETITRIFILHGHTLAAQNLTREQLEGALALHSTAYFCPQCGDVWARIVYSHHPDDWDCVVRWCDKHRPKWEAAMVGCFSDPTYTAPLKLYPREVLLHDLKQMVFND